MRSIAVLPVLDLLLMPLQANAACNGMSNRPRTGRAAMDRIKNLMDWV